MEALTLHSRARNIITSGATAAVTTAAPGHGHVPRRRSNGYALYRRLVAGFHLGARRLLVMSVVPTFKPEINIGHIAIVLSMLVTTVVYGVRLEGRVSAVSAETGRLDRAVERLRDDFTANTAAVEMRAGSNIGQLRDDIARLEDKVDRLLLPPTVR